MNYTEHESVRKAYESAQKDAQEFIRNNICTGELVKKDETGN